MVNVKNYSSILIFLILFSCAKDTAKQEELEPTKEMAKILNAFVKENKCNGCEYEIYVDKEDPHNYTTIIFVGDHSLTKHENSFNKQSALNRVTVSGIKFKIYSGIEYYFKNPSTLSKFKSDTIRQFDIEKTKIWVVKDSFGKLTTTKRSFAYPFMPLPGPEVNLKDVIMMKKDSTK